METKTLGNLELKKRVLLFVGEEISDKFPKLEVKPVTEVLSYKTSYKACGGGYLEGATHMANVTRKERQRTCGFALSSGDVSLDEIGDFSIVHQEHRPQGLEAYCYRQVAEYKEIPREGFFARLFNLPPRKEPLKYINGALLLTYTNIDSVDRLKIHQDNSDLIKAVEKVLPKFGIESDNYRIETGICKVSHYADIFFYPF